MVNGQTTQSSATQEQQSSDVSLSKLARVPTVQIEALRKEMRSCADGHIRRLLALAIGCFETAQELESIGLEGDTYTATIERGNHFLKQASDLLELATAEEEEQHLEDFQWLEVYSKDVGGKLSLTDLENNPSIQRAAQWYLRKGYAELAVPFSFMDEMVDALKTRGALSLPQLKGVANCLVASIRNEARKEAIAAYNRRKELNAKIYGGSDTTVEPVIHRGIYTVVFDKDSSGNPDYITVRVTLAKPNQNYPRPKGTQIVSYLFGSNNEGDYKGFATLVGDCVDPWRGTESESRPMKALEVLLRGGKEIQENAGKEYALMSGNCWVCGRTLTTPESIEAGIGPICSMGF